MSRFSFNPRALFLVLLLAIGLLNCVYATGIVVWSPRDEIAHYDYIERAGGLSLPRPSDAISDQTFEMCEELAWQEPKPLDGSRRSMGLAGRSYEAQQPPLYYLVLAGPNVLLQSLEFDAETRVKALRLAGTLAQLAGALLFIPVVRIFARSSGASELYGYLFAFLALATNVHYFGTLGNDAFSLLAANATLLAFALHLGRSPGRAGIGWCAIAATAAVWVKVINLPLLAVPIAAWWVAVRQDQRAHSAWQMGLFLAPMAAIPLLFLTNWQRFGGFTGSAEVAGWFSKFVHPVVPATAFLKTLAVDIFNVSHIWKILPRDGAYVVLVLMLLNLAWATWEWRSNGHRRAAITLLGIAATSLMFALAALLNRQDLGVHWNASRHYLGMIPVIYCGILGIHRLGTRFELLGWVLLTLSALGHVILLGWRILERSG